jgi:hypothetical protein
MSTLSRTVLGLLIAAALFGSPPGAGASPPAHRPATIGMATLPRATGLEMSEALLEDLNFRNLELHDRETLLKNGAGGRSTGKLTFSVNDGSWGAVFVPTPIPPTARPAGHGPAPAADLAAYVRLLAHYRSSPIVTGRFSDWRSTSVYRAMAGLHYGYDIAYPAGTLVEAGWGGQVISIANWYGAEYGITVQSPEGFRTTYGHLHPLTRVGAWVNPGDVVGRVVNDHVDVKMRHLGGGFIDFAHGVPGIAGKASSYVSAAGLPVSSQGGRVVLTLKIHPTAPKAGPRILPPLAGPAWTRRGESVRAAIAYLRVRHQEAALLLQGPEAPRGALAAVRREIEQARGRLLVTGVPEDVLLAAFVQSETLADAEFWFGRGLSSATQVDVLDDDAVHRREMIHTARQALPQLQALLRDLNAQPPPRRS